MRKGVVFIILFCENSKKTKRCIAERKRSGTNEKRLALFLLLAGLLKVRELRLLGREDLPVWMSLVIEFESVISARKVMLRLIFNFSVAFGLIKKLDAVASVFCHRGLISFKALQEPCHAMFSLLTQPSYRWIDIFAR